MKRTILIPALALSLVFSVGTASAYAGLVGTSVTGTLTFGAGASTFGAGAINYFDSSNGFVPAAGYLNSPLLPPTVVVSNTFVEFGYFNGARLVEANFTDNMLTISDDVSGSTGPWEMTFTDSAFAGLTLLETVDGFSNGGLTASLVGNTITVNWAGTPVLDDSFSFNGFGGSAPTFSATFSLTAAAVPLPPAAWSGGAALGVIALISLVRKRRLTV